MAWHDDEVPIRIDAPNDVWARQFEQERDTLEPVLAAWLVAPVEHIGSTSVRGLDAKPIIDPTRCTSTV